jgi:hypothetical protein
MDNYSATMAVDYSKVLNSNQYIPAPLEDLHDDSSSADALEPLLAGLGGPSQSVPSGHGGAASLLLINAYGAGGERGEALCLVESQKYVLPRFLTTHLAQGFKWDYSDILRDLRARSSVAAFEAYLASLLKLTHLYEDFVRSARLNAKVLIGMARDGDG